MFNQKSNTAFNAQSKAAQTIEAMQPSIQKLYKIALDKKDLRTPTAVARYLQITQQTLKNWESRGISKEGALKVQSALGLDSNQLLALNTTADGHAQAPPLYRPHDPTRDTVVILANDNKPQLLAAWPFETVTVDDWHTLQPAQKAAIEAVINAYTGQGQSAHQATPETKTATG